MVSHRLIHKSDGLPRRSLIPSGTYLTQKKPREPSAVSLIGAHVTAKGSNIPQYDNQLAWLILWPVIIIIIFYSAGRFKIFILGVGSLQARQATSIHSRSQGHHSKRTDAFGFMTCTCPWRTDTHT